MRRNYSHVLTAFYGMPWAILPEKFRELEAVLWRRIESGPLTLETSELTQAAREKLREDFRKLHTGIGHGQPVMFEDGGSYSSSQDRGSEYQLIGAAAVIPVYGTISARPSLFPSGGTSAEGIGRAVDLAAADPKVEALVLDFDTPGGAVFGTPEAAAKILAARKVKPVHAVANHTAASGGYWLASQATDIAVSSTGWVGSIGVIWPRLDDTKAEELAGLKTTYIAAGENKTDGYGPMTTGEAERMQEMVNAYYTQFVAAVAKGRGVSVAKVEKDFGQGGVKLPADAIASRMADRIATLEQVVNEVNGTRTERTKRKVAADLAAAGFPTA